MILFQWHIGKTARAKPSPMLSRGWLSQQHTYCSSGAFSQEEGAHFFRQSPAKTPTVCSGSFSDQLPFHLSPPALTTVSCDSCADTAVFPLLSNTYSSCLWGGAGVTACTDPPNNHTILQEPFLELDGRAECWGWRESPRISDRALGFHVEQFCTSAAFSIMAKMEIGKPNKSWRPCPYSLGTGLPPHG